MATEKSQNGQDEQFEESAIGYDIRIPQYINDRTDLTLRQKVLWGVVKGLSSKKGYCWASNAYLATLVKDGEKKLDDRSVRRLMAPLVKAGLLVKGFSEEGRILMCKDPLPTKGGGLESPGRTSKSGEDLKVRGGRTSKSANTYSRY